MTPGEPVLTFFGKVYYENDQPYADSFNRDFLIFGYFGLYFLDTNNKWWWYRVQDSKVNFEEAIDDAMPVLKEIEEDWKKTKLLDKLK